MALLCDLGDRVEGSGGACKASFVKGALQQLAVALCRGNELNFCMYGFNYARVSGCDFVPGDLVPSDGFD